MKCETYQTELEDYIYGELSESRAAQVRAHLAVCLTCEAARAELEREQKIFTQFYEQSALDPSAEMWDAIRARITAETARQEAPSTGWLKRLLSGSALSWLLNPVVIRQAAFALVLIALSVAITTLVLRRERNEEKNLAQVTVTPTPTASTPAPAPQSSATPVQIPTPAAVIAQQESSLIKPGRETGKAQPPARRLTDQEKLNQQIARAEREYQGAIRMLETAIAKRRDMFDPDLVKQYESSLALIDTSIAASRRALRERPGDPSAGQFLLAAYARKVELMQDIAMR